jgi:hypothetical protein
MRVYLARKLAEKIDGVDLTAYKPGDVVDLPPSEAQLIIAEKWGIPERRAADRGEQRGYSVSRRSDVAPSEQVVGGEDADRAVQSSSMPISDVAADRSSQRRIDPDS